MKTKILITLISTSFILHSTFLRAAPGDLDLNFAGTGKLRLGFGGGYAYCSAAAVQSDNKLVMAGNTSDGYYSPHRCALVRYTTNGVLDATFGDWGVVLTKASSIPDSYNPNEGFNAVGIQADGKIVAAGYSHQNYIYNDFTLVRYNPDGSLDTTFGTNGTGIVDTDFGGGSVINALAIQPDGKIVAAGQAPSSAGYSIAMARYQTNGTLDDTFGSGGRVVCTNFQGLASGLMLQSDGKIVAVGNLFSSYPHSDLALLRYTTNGVLDTTFGGAGTGEVFPPIYNDLELSPYNPGVALQRGGITVGNQDRIVVFDAEQGGTYAVVRLNLDGLLDTTFGNGGIVTNALSSGFSYEYAQAVLIQRSYGPLGTVHILVAGSADNTNSSTTEFLLTRYNGDGSPDTSFGPSGDGKVDLSFGAGHDDGATAMAFQAGKIVLAGNSYSNSNNSDFAAARFNTDGSLDTTFGSSGVVTADIANLPAEANGVAVQPDGKILVVGDASNDVEKVFATARYNPDGVLDDTFGSNDGKVTTAVGASNAVANAVQLQPDGRIVVAGTAYNGTDNDFALARYNTNGALDFSFGNAGTKMISVGSSNAIAKAVAVQSDGKIVAAGVAYDNVSGYNQFALARFNTNGALDTSFGNAGRVITSFTSTSAAEAAQIQSDGKIVLSGSVTYSNGGQPAQDFALARYNTNGSLDFSFGSLGRAAANVGVGTLDTGSALAIQPDSRIIVAGGAALGANSYVALARFTTNGVLDPTFGAGGSGTVITEVGASSDFATALALQPDGKILVAGASQNGDYKFFALRYNPDGSLDTSYGNNGSKIIDFGTGTNEFAYALALDSSGRAVIAGDAGGWFGVARLLGDALPEIPLTISLPSPNTAEVSWPYPSTGWDLQENSDLSKTNWITPPEMVNKDGTNNYILVNPPINNEFYRLFKP